VYSLPPHCSYVSRQLLISGVSIAAVVVVVVVVVVVAEEVVVEIA